MILFPFAKINLGLRVIGKRQDAYHEIESILYPIGLCDLLECIPGTRDHPPSLVISGDHQHQHSDDDLLLRTYRALPRAHKPFPPRMQLHKRIPPAAGLGGGSSDAAQLIRYYADDRIPDPFNHEDPFLKTAASVGSDVPFFLQDLPLLVSGRGEKMSPLPIDLGGWKLLLLVPPCSVSTAQAYGSYRPKAEQSSPLKEVARTSVSEWRTEMVNDLEPGVFRLYPELKTLKDKLYAAGASYASMTGSGSGVFGLFEEEPPSIQGTEDHFEWRQTLPSIT